MLSVPIIVCLAPIAAVVSRDCRSRRCVPVSGEAVVSGVARLEITKRARPGRHARLRRVAGGLRCVRGRQRTGRRWSARRPGRTADRHPEVRIRRPLCVTNPSVGRVGQELTARRPAVRRTAAQTRDVPPRSPYDNLVHPRTVKKASPEVEAERDLVVEDPSSGFVGAVVRREKDVVHLEDRVGKVRAYPLGPGFWVDGRPVVLVRPERNAPSGPQRSASGSTYVVGARARVAREGRIYVEGKHDAELVEKVWGHDLRIEGVVVEPLHGVDDLPGIVRDFRPSSGRRLGVLVDHLVTGSKESRIAGQVTGEHALVVGHPFVDIWQAVKPSVVGIRAWPVVPKGESWKDGVCRRLGWEDDTGYVWAQRILARVRTWTDLEPALIGRVEELIDFVTESP